MDTDTIIAELQKCADRHRAIHSERQKLESRVLFTVLTFYAGTTLAILKITSSPDVVLRVGISVGFLAFAVLTSALLKRLHFSNRVNITIAENFEAEVIRMLDLPRSPIPQAFQKAETEFDNVRNVTFLGTNWGWQSSMMFAFAIVCSLLLWIR